MTTSITCPTCHQPLPRHDDTPDRAIAARLTARDGVILDLLCAGKTYREIAAARGLSVPTVAAYLQRIYGTMGVKNKYAAAYRWVHVRPVWERDRRPATSQRGSGGE